MKIRILVLLSLITPFGASAQYLGAVVAGGGGLSASSNNVPATSVPLGVVSGVAVDAVGNVYATDGALGVAYGVTTSDYATGYYYDLCTYLAALGEEDDDTTWDYYYTSSSCGSTDAEVSWSFSTYGTTDFVQFSGQNIEYIDYYVYQMDEYCGGDEYDCDAYWDAFEDSLLAGDGCGGGASFSLYGPPAIAYYAQQIAQSTITYGGTYCDKPSGETSTYNGYSGITLQYGADFLGTIIPSVISGSNYSGRQVQESVTMTGPLAGTAGGCWWSGNDGSYPQPTTSLIYNNYSTWTVGSPSANQYGGDDISAPTNAASYFQSKLNGAYSGSDPIGGQPSCQLFIQTQYMYINGCAYGSTPSILYNASAPNINTFSVYPTYYYAYRHGASGLAD